MKKLISIILTLAILLPMGVSVTADVIKQFSLADIAFADIDSLASSAEMAILKFGDNGGIKKLDKDKMNEFLTLLHQQFPLVETEDNILAFDDFKREDTYEINFLGNGILGSVYIQNGFVAKYGSFMSSFPNSKYKFLADGERVKDFIESFYEQGEDINNGKKAGTFPDTENHWADGDIVILYHTGMADGIPTLVDGVEMNLYYPDKSLTRAEFSKLISKSLNLTKNYASTNAYDDALSVSNANEFADVKENDWFYIDTLVVKNAGIMKGFPDKTFKPEQLVTREETAQIIINYCNYINKYRDESNKLSIGSVTEKYIDDDEISGWAKEAVYSLPPIQGSTGNNVMQGYPDGTFKPKGYLTRGEVAAVMVRLCERRG